MIANVLIYCLTTENKNKTNNKNKILVVMLDEGPLVEKDKVEKLIISLKEKKVIHIINTQTTEVVSTFVAVIL